MKTFIPEDPRAEEARRLRADSRMSLAQLREHFGVSRDTMAAWLWDEPTPEWTRRPRAKDEVRAQAITMRQGGATVPEIALALGVSKSTAYLWVKHLPLDETSERAQQRRSEHSRRVSETRWEPLRRKRDADRAAVNEAEAAWVGGCPTERSGCSGRWPTGARVRRPSPGSRTGAGSPSSTVIRCSSACSCGSWSRLGEDRQALKYRVSIHESADAEAAGRWWAEAVGVPFEIFRRPTLKTHNPSTVRHNVGDPYRGCLVVDVPDSRSLYWRIEGLMGGIAAAKGSIEEVKM